jgi:hypothetical protein
MCGRRWNRDWWIFDYHRWLESRLSESQRQQTTCVVARATRHLGSLSIEPKIPLLGRVMAAVEPHGLIEFADPEFDDKFLVRSPNPQDAFALLQPPLRQYLLSLWHGPERWYRVAHVHEDILLIVESGSASVKHIGKMMEMARCFLDTIDGQA